MKKRITELLENKCGNYILPFFWQHGEDEETLRLYMSKIAEANIRAVCVEARPHPDFASDGWWHDLDIIMDEARKRDMKVWVLDDAHFPTGYANGALKEADEVLCKLYLDIMRVDIAGPMPSVMVDLSQTLNYNISPMGKWRFAGADKPKLFSSDEIVKIIACDLVEGDTLGVKRLDITDKISDNKLIWDVPAGLWRVFVILKTRNGGGRTDYINMLDEASCRVQIDAVYEPHFEHYRDDFGKTFAGFFSDEPLVGNTYGYAMDEDIGKKIMPLPWSDEMPQLMSEQLGDDYEVMLPALWADVTDKTVSARVRFAYMDSATRLIEQNFSRQIGTWCEEHGVEYIGHIIEDNDQHMRLGCSQGHFFRAMAGQHMSGIDDIGGQVLIGQDVSRRLATYEMFARNDGEFFHYALGKLGSSFAHIDPKKKGRAMCEIFGNYGWGEGVRLMKYLADHFLVRGINYFVPHAFSAKDFPDDDCPPHFYAHGNNPQFSRFGELMKYMNRVCHLFQNGQHHAPVALLYPAESAWMGDAMAVQKPARVLLENQIDFDIIPADVFTDAEYNARFDNGKLIINNESYEALVIPCADFLPDSVLEFIENVKKQEFTIIRLTEDGLGKLPNQLFEANIYDIKLDKSFPSLRYYHYERGGEHGFMFSNESSSETFDGKVCLKQGGRFVKYDAAFNRLYEYPAEQLADGFVIHITLRPFESLILISGEFDNAEALPDYLGTKEIDISEGWLMSSCKECDYPKFTDETQMDRLSDISIISPDFCGHLRYEKTIEVDEVLDKNMFLTIENAFEGPALWVNGVLAGTRLAPPYEFDITGLLKHGKNNLRIEVATTMARSVADSSLLNSMLARSVAVYEPIGLVGGVHIKF